MAEPSAGEKIPLNLSLSPELARRLMLAAESQKRTPASLVAILLDRHLPRLQTGESKNKIPYT